MPPILYRRFGLIERQEQKWGRGAGGRAQRMHALVEISFGISMGGGGCRGGGMRMVNQRGSPPGLNLAKTAHAAVGMGQAYGLIECGWHVMC